VSERARAKRMDFRMAGRKCKPEAQCLVRSANAPFGEP
jgi:hypothetical protein